MHKIKLKKSSRIPFPTTTYALCRSPAPFLVIALALSLCRCSLPVDFCNSDHYLPSETLFCFYDEFFKLYLLFFTSCCNLSRSSLSQLLQQFFSSAWYSRVHSRTLSILLLLRVVSCSLLQRPNLPRLTPPSRYYSQCLLLLFCKAVVRQHAVVVISSTKSKLFQMVSL